MRFQFTILLFLVAYSLSAQSEIQYHLPLPFSTDLTAIDVAPDDQGFAVGSCGYLLRTVDAGANWESIDSPTEEDFINVACRPGTGCEQVFATTFNTLYRSLDGGDSWTATAIPGNGSIKGIVFTGDNQTIVISRNVTTLTLSRDNGETFEQIFMGHAPATIMQFVTPDKGFFFSNMTNMVVTEDGGETWTSIYDHPEGVRGMNFLDENIGFMYSASGLLFKTTNGGANWVEISAYENIRFLFTEMEVRSETMIELTTFRGVHRSIDGGLNFTELINVNINADFTNDIGLSDVHRSGQQYWLAGSNTSILFSEDDLLTLNHQLGEARIPFTAIDLDGEEIYALTFQDGMVRSLNGGETFEPVVTNGFLTGYDLLVLQDGRVIVAGNGQPKISSDQGETFENLLSDGSIPDVAYRRVEQLDNERIVVAGQEGIAIFSDDNMQSWTVANHGLYGTMSNFSSFGQVLGLNTIDSFAVSLDGGATWPILREMPDIVGMPSKVFFALDAETWIISRISSGALYRTDDAGQTWESTGISARSVVMDNNGRLYGANSNGLIFSENLGASWESAGVDLCSPFGLPFLDIAYDENNEKVFVAGRGRRLFSVDVSEVVSSNRQFTAPEPLKIFPNPSKGRVSLSLPETAAASQVDVQLFSPTGQLLLTERHAFNTRLELNLNDQPAGIYLVRVSGNGWSKVARLVVSR